MTKYIDHDGTTINNLPANVMDKDIVEVVLRDGSSHRGLAAVYDWTHNPDDSDNDIVAYTVDGNLVTGSVVKEPDNGMDIPF